MIIVFQGSIGRSGLGGQAWANLQYLIGLRELGHDVYYLEDCGETSWAYDWEAGDVTSDLAYPAAYVRDSLEPFGFAGRWLYRAGEEGVGLPLPQFREICAAADLMIMRALPIFGWREEYSWPRRRAFIDVDPGFTQAQIAGGDTDLGLAIDRCERLFTYGQRFGAPDCSCPTAERTWLPTLPPVALSEWPYVALPPRSHFTAVMRWNCFDDTQYAGKTYGQKDREFLRFIDLPRQTKQKFRLAIIGPPTLAEHGWEFLPGEVATRTAAGYRDFIQNSRAEFGVAKHGYVQMRSGWFSDRSVCYLASGRPVLLQDTGIASWLPTGTGVVTFSDPESALAGIDAINADYETHSRQARQLAERVFSTQVVLPQLLAAAMS